MPISTLSPKSPRLTAIAAMAANRVIGKDGKLPWHLPEDLKFFKRTTLGRPVLMGRKTYDSIIEAIGKPLPGRKNIVLSRSIKEAELGHDVTVIRDIADLGGAAGNYPMVYLIGGAQLYQSLLPICDELLLTKLDASYEGDTYFPAFEEDFPHPPQLLLEGEGFTIWHYSREAV